MGWLYDSVGETQNAYTSLVGKPLERL